MNSEDMILKLYQSKVGFNWALDVMNSDELILKLDQSTKVMLVKILVGERSC